MPTVTDAEGNTVFLASRVLSDNLLHNPDGRISQRASPSTTTDDTYGGPDRWYSLTQTASVSASKAALTGYPSVHVVTQTQAVAQRMGRAQIIEWIDCAPVLDSDVILSGVAYTLTGSNMMVALLEWDGATDVVTSDVVNDWTSTDYTPGVFFISTVRLVSITEIIGNVAVPTRFAITGKFTNSMDNVIVFIWTKDAAAQSDGLYFRVKLEKGVEETEFISPDPTLELLRCMRYFQRRFVDVLATECATGGFKFNADLAIQMRGNPTVVAGAFTNVNITGTPATTSDGKTLLYSGTPTVSNTHTQISCDGTTLSSDM